MPTTIEYNEGDLVKCPCGVNPTSLQVGSSGKGRSFALCSRCGAWASEIDNDEEIRVDSVHFKLIARAQWNQDWLNFENDD